MRKKYHTCSRCGSKLLLETTGNYKAILNFTDKKHVESNSYGDIIEYSRYRLGCEELNIFNEDWDTDREFIPECRYSSFFRAFKFYCTKCGKEDKFKTMLFRKLNNEPEIYPKKENSRKRLKF